MSVTVSVQNNTTTDASSVRLLIYDPDRKNLLSEQTVNISVLAGSSNQLITDYTSPLTASLGIYHIDYIFYDANGIMIQPQAETGSGRFVVSNPPQVGYKGSGITFSVQSDAGRYLVGSTAIFTINIWNNTDVQRTITVKYDDQTQIVTIAPKSRESITYSKIVASGGVLRVSFYDENSKSLSSFSAVYYALYPSILQTVKTDKTLYAKSETVTVKASLKDLTQTSWQPLVKIIITDTGNAIVFEDTKTVSLLPSGSTNITTSYTLPTTLTIGTYTVRVEVWYGTTLVSSTSTSFELTQSRILVTPNLPSAFASGSNIISFILNNRSEINVSSGTLEVSLKDPDGAVVDSGSHFFAIGIGETINLNIPITVPPFKLGYYILSYTQSDETKQGQPATLAINNNLYIGNYPLDKLSYKVRETANLTITITNTEKFNLENVSVTVSAPDANYTNTQTTSLLSANSQQLTYVIPIPETMTAGQHNVNVTLTLPSGSSIAQSSKISIPKPTLNIKYSGPTTIIAGDTINLTIENTGGVDVSIINDITLSDEYGMVVYWDTYNDTVIAGGKGSYSFQIPSQISDGTYNLGINSFDSSTGLWLGYVYKSFDISGLKAGVSVKTDKDIYLSTEEIISLSTITTEAVGISDGWLDLKVERLCEEPPIVMSIYISSLVSGGWFEFGTLHFSREFSTQELDTSGYLPGMNGYVLQLGVTGSDYAQVDYIALRDSNGNIYAPTTAAIGNCDYYPPYSCTPLEDITTKVSIEDNIGSDVGFFAEWNNIPQGITDLTLIMRAKEWSALRGCDVWGISMPVNQLPLITDTINTLIGSLGDTGKFYLKATLSNSFGQEIASTEYPFYVIDGDFAFIISTDKKTYKPGEIVTITGEVKNLSAIQADGVNIELKDEISGSILYTATADIPAQGTYPFTITTTANTEGVYNLKGTAEQNNSILAESLEQYKVAKPAVFVDVTMPDVAGNEPFEININLFNDGETEANIQFTVDSSQFTDTQNITIPPKETRFIQYRQQINQDTDYTFTFTGDYEDTIKKTVSYGLAASIAINSQPAYSEGTVAVPVTITNTGQFDTTIDTRYKIQDSGNNIIQEQSKTYYIPKGESITDTLYLDLTEGGYQITAFSSQPSANATANFSVKKDVKVDMTVSVGAQSNSMIPVTVNLTNIGFSEFNSSVQLSVVSSQGSVVWNSEQHVIQLLPQNSQLLTFNINPSSIKPGDYTLKAELLNNSGQQIGVQSLELRVQGAIFQIIQLPPYSTFTVGEEATFIFKIKNTGNQEGAAELSFKAYDLIDSSQTEWLAPQEEKSATFSFILPDDLEEKDYFADYQITDARTQSTDKGQVKYRVAGINLSVNASLDKQNYSEGETAYLTISVSTLNSQLQTLNLFARVNYAGYESQQSFLLNVSQTLTFDIPLTQITGEKIFYGIYYESGRSIHLNSLYIYKAGDVITITTDKQVYNAGETVVITVTSQESGVTGTMILTAPSYEETFAFSGSATRSFTLPSQMPAGTYFITYQFTDNASRITYNGSHPFDVVGISVKVKEATLDKGKYASSDTLKLSLTIESNQNLSATLKTWIVDPEGKYTSVGENGIILSSSEPLLLTSDFSLLTSISGIHRLVYGIYSGDLLLASGSEAFDVGDAVLLGLSTDKTDYPTNTESVTATISAYGTVDATLELQLDGSTIITQSISFSSIVTLNINIGTITPGAHALKAILTAGGLKSTKETTFTYGSNLPDLTTVISNQWSVNSDNTVPLLITVTNQGKTPSASTTISLYEDDNLIETRPVNGLGQGKSQGINFNWNVLGKAGAHIIKAMIDADNTVIEFNEENNEAQLSIIIPNVIISTETAEETYYSGEVVDINTSIANLTQSVISGLIVNTTITNESDNTIFTSNYPLANIKGEETVNIITPWDTDKLVEGVYKITQVVISPEGLAQSSDSKEITLLTGRDFNIVANIDYQKIKVGEMASYSLSLIPIGEFDESVFFSVDGVPEGASAIFNPSSVVPPGNFVLIISTSSMTFPGRYSLTVTANGADKTHTVNLTLDVTDFAITISPLSQSVLQLDSTIYNVTLTPINGFDSEVKVNIEPLPYGLYATLNPETVTPSADIALTIWTSKYPVPGNYTISVKAVSGIITKTASATLDVVPNPLIVGGIITGAGPGPQNKAWVRIFKGNGAPIGDGFLAYPEDIKYGVKVSDGGVGE